MQSGFCCPVCGGVLTRTEKVLCCEQGHSFDIARKGYVNLLMSQKSKEKRHGDDALMIAARRDFLNSGAYERLRRETAQALLAYAQSGDVLLDAGCGECYYTDYICKQAAEKSISLTALGIDISKEALAGGAKRNSSIELSVASIYSLPVSDGSINLLLNMFAPYVASEFSRVLSKDGILVRTFPRERHLWELKAAIYDTPYENEIETTELEGFETLASHRITYPIALENHESIEALFRMTPYYYKTSKEGQARAAALQSLTVTADFALIVYRKR